MGIAREEAKKVIERLPDEASWDDVIYEMYVRKKIEEGLNAVEKGDVVTHEEAKERLLRK